MKKTMICLAMLLVVGFGSVCVNSDDVQNTYPVYKNGSLYTTLAVNETCDYGCDQTLNRCRTVDVGYGALVFGALIFFIVVMFYLAYYFRPKRDEEGEIDLGAIGLSFFWLFVGLLGILGLLFFVSGIGANIVSAFIGSSVEWIKTFTTIYSYMLGAFIVFVALFYIKAFLDNLNVGKEEK